MSLDSVSSVELRRLDTVTGNSTTQLAGPLLPERLYCDPAPGLSALGNATSLYVICVDEGTEDSEPADNQVTVLSLPGLGGCPCVV